MLFFLQCTVYTHDSTDNRQIVYLTAQNTTNNLKNLLLLYLLGKIFPTSNPANVGTVFKLYFTVESHFLSHVLLLNHTFGCNWKINQQNEHTIAD